MSPTIDERVVEMRFDSKQFQSEAKSTLGVLDRLKEALKFTDAGKGLENLNKSVNDVRLDGIASGIDMLTKRFSTFGIVGMQIIQNVTNALTNKLVGAVRYAEDAIVSGGIRRAMNIENAHFQLQALLKDEVKVQEVMANAMESVDGTAYAYDEAAKAASMFAASGIQAGDDMLNALKGITGVAAMTNSEFEAISMIFTTVAGNGRLMGDQLLQLSSRGLNAASTIADYMREVQKQSDITETEIREMVSDGKISFKTFSDAMNWAFGESAKRANETFTGAMSNMKSALARIGAGFVSPLVEQNGVLVDAFNTLRVKINEIKSELVFDEETSAVNGLSKAFGVSVKQAQKFYDKIEKQGKLTIKNISTIKDHGENGYKELKRYFNGINDGSIRASYSITQTVKALTDGNEVTKKDIRKFVKQGKIDFDIFSAAYERAFGTDHQKLSKQFTDTVTKVVDTLRGEVEKFDVTMITDNLYKGFNSLKNILYGLYTILKPVGQAFYDVFLGFNYDDISNFTTNVEKLTAKFRLSDESADKLRRTFTGIFDIFALLGDGVISLIRAFTPFGDTIKEGSGSLLDLTANLGDTLTEFSKWVRTNKRVQAGFETFSKSVATVAKSISLAGHGISDFVTMVWEMEETQRVISKVGDIFTKFGTTVQKISKSVVDSVSEFVDKLGEIEFTNMKEVLKGISEAFSALGSTLMKNEGVRAFVENFKEFLGEVEHALSKDTIVAKLEALKKAFSSFWDFLKEFASFISDMIFPLFNDLTLGGVASAGLGAGIVASIFKLSKVLGGISESFSGVPDVLGAIKDTLEGYQDNLKADSIRKIAGAIAILAGALVLLSFADTDRLLGAAMALSTISAVLLGGITALTAVSKKGRVAADALTVFSGHIGKAFTQIGKGIKWKLVGSALKDFGIAVGLIAAAVAGMAVLYKYDPKSTMKAFDMMKEIVIGMVGVMTTMSILGKIIGTGMKSFQQAATGVAALSVSMLLIITAVNKLMKMQIPSDYQGRMKILGEIFVALAGLTVAVGVASRIAGKGALSALSIVSMCALLVVAVNSLKRLFEMDLPSDYDTKMLIFKDLISRVADVSIAVGFAGRLAGKSSFAPILALSVFLYSAVSSLKRLMEVELPRDWADRFLALEAIFVTLGFVMRAVASAGRWSGGAVKATGTILAMCVFLATASASLMVLSIIPAEGMLKGATALGIILLNLAITLRSVSKITDENAYKVVLAMAVTIGAITASLGVLSMISVEALAKSGLALGGTLLALAINFKAVSKITNDKVWIDILAMVGAMAAIVGALTALTMFDMEQLRVSATALSAVLLAFSVAMRIIGKSTDINKEQMLSFLAASLVLVPITMALSALADYPWDGLLAASASLSMTMLAFAEAMKIISLSGNINLAQMAVFLAGSLSILPIAAALSMVAKYDWQNVLAAGASITAVMLSLSVALGVISVVGAAVPAALAGILLLDLLVADLVLVLTALGKLNEIPGVQELVSGGGDLLAKIGEALGKLVSGIGVGLASGLPQIGESLSQFAVSVTPFVATMQAFSSMNAVKGCTEIVKMILALTAASFIQGVSNFLSIFTGESSFEKLGKELSTFGPYIRKFSEDVSGINAGAVTAASAAGQMIAKLYEALPKTGGWMQQILGETKSLTQFGIELTGFGPSIALFANQVKDVKPEAVKGATAAAKTVATIYEHLPKQGGWMQRIMGETMSLSQFADELEDFGDPISSFATKVENVKASSVQGAASAAKMIAKIYDLLPKQGGWMKVITGDTMTLSEFGDELEDFAEPIVNFSKDVENVKEGSVKGAEAAARIMATLAEDLPDTKNLGEKIFGGGTMTLTEFGNQLKEFAPYISDFVEEVEDIKETDVEGAMDAVTLITNTIDTITKSEIKTSLTAFGEQLKKFGESLVTFYNQMVKTDFSEVSTITSNIKNLVKVATDAGEKGASGFVKAINSQNGSVTKAVNSMISRAVATLRVAHSRFKMSGQQAGQKFIEGITNKLANSIIGLKKNAANLGKYYVQGFAQGVNNNLSIASRAAANMARRADEAVAKELDEHSPSKLAEKRGTWYTQGFIIGLLKNRSNVEKSSRVMVSAMDGAFLQQLIESRRLLSKNMDEFVDIFAKNTKKISNSVDYIGKKMKDLYNTTQGRLNAMTSAIETSYKSMNSMQDKYNAKVKEQEKEQEESEKKQQAYEEEVQKQEERIKRQEELSKMSAKERAKQLREERKEARITAEAQAIAYKKIYGDQKKEQKDFLDTTTEYYNNFLKVKTSGNNQALYEDKSFEEAEIDILKRITETLESYKEKFESTRDSIMKEMDFFESVDKEKEIKTKEELIQNAKDQLDIYQEYISVQGQLRTKLAGTELYKYLETFGVDSTAQLKVINEMTDEELNQYVSLYDQKFQLATVAAKQQLADYQSEMEAQLEDILGGVIKNIDLDSFADQFNGKLTSILGSKKTKKTFLERLTNFYQNNIKDLSKTVGFPIAGLLAAGVKKEEIASVVKQQPEAVKELKIWTGKVAKDASPSSKKAGKTLANAAKKGITEMYGDFYSVGSIVGGNVASGIRSQIGAVRQAVEELRAAANEANSIKASTNSAGSSVSEGFASGILSGSNSVANASGFLAAIPSSVISSSLGIHSPSKVMDKYGQYTVLGYINGMMRMLSKAAAVASEIGESTEKGVEDEASRISMIFDDMLIDPVITPIVDMSNIERSIEDINHMFNDSIRIASADAMTTSGYINRRMVSENGAVRLNGTTNYFTFEQHNSSPKALSAIDIYRNTKNQFTQFRERVEGV